MNWVSYQRELWSQQPLPPEKRYVLVMIDGEPAPSHPSFPQLSIELPPAVAVGYLKYAAGDPDSPGFIVPGVAGTVVAWCDCLGDDFHAPLWRGRQTVKQG